MLRMGSTIFGSSRRVTLLKIGTDVDRRDQHDEDQEQDRHDRAPDPPGSRQAADNAEQQHREQAAQHQVHPQTLHLISHPGAKGLRGESVLVFAEIAFVNRERENEDGGENEVLHPVDERVHRLEAGDPLRQSRACGPTTADSATAARSRLHRESPKGSASNRLRNRRRNGPSCRRESAPDTRWWPPWHRSAARPAPRLEPGSRMASGSRLVVERARELCGKLRRIKSGNRVLSPGMFVRASCLSPEIPIRSSVYGVRVPGVPVLLRRGAGLPGEDAASRVSKGSKGPGYIRLRSRLGDFGDGRLAVALRLLRTEMVLGQSFFQELETFFRRIGHLEQFEVRR